MNGAQHNKTLARREAICKARNDFNQLDTYARGIIAQQGVAFTTHEDNGPVYCTELNRLAVAWRAELEPVAGNVEALLVAVRRGGVPL